MWHVYFFIIYIRRSENMINMIFFNLLTSRFFVENSFSLKVYCWIVSSLFSWSSNKFNSTLVAELLSPSYEIIKLLYCTWKYLLKMKFFILAKFIFIYSYLFFFFIIFMNNKHIIKDGALHFFNYFFIYLFGITNRWARFRHRYWVLRGIGSSDAGSKYLKYFLGGPPILNCEMNHLNTFHKSYNTRINKCVKKERSMRLSDN